jgi:hypothetical protein
MPRIEQCDKSFKIVMSVIIMGDGRDGNAIAGKGISVRFTLGIAKAFYFNFMLCPVPNPLLAVPFLGYAP